MTAANLDQHRTGRYVAVLAPGLAGAAMFLTLDARACGVSGVDGVASCSIAEHREATRSRWAVSASGVLTSTRLRFSGGVRGDETRYAALGTLSYLPTAKLALQLGAGATFGGALVMPDGRHEFDPGPAASLGASYLVFDDGWFVILTSVLAFSAARTQLAGERSVGYEAFDLRLGAQIGATLFDILRPYVPLRIFGGPVFWNYGGAAVTGTDTHHFQVGAGVALRLARPVNVFAEGIALGERAVSFGVALAL
jgi:hypothetical protein